MRRKAKVIDSRALAAFFEGREPEAGKVEDALAQAHEEGSPLFMTTVNLGEVWYSSARAASASAAEERMADVVKLGVEIVPADWGLAHQASQYKARGGVSYADCFALALAKTKNAELITGDPAFKAFKDEVKIQWL